MRRQRPVVWLLVLLSCFAGASAAAAHDAQSEAAQDPWREPGIELVQNGDLETLAADGLPAGFHLSRFAGDAPLGVDETVYRSPGRSVRIDGDTRTRLALTQTLSVEGGKSYRFRVWYRSENMERRNPRHIIARLQTWDRSEAGQNRKVPWSVEWTATPSSTWAEIAGGENLHLFPGEYHGEGEWRPLEAVFTLPEEATTLQINLFNWFGDESVWYDDVSLVQLPQTIDFGDREIRSSWLSDWSGEPVLSTLKPEHPRLLVSMEDFERIQSLIGTDRLALGWYGSLRGTANSLIYQAPSTYEIPDGVRLLATSRRVLERVEVLAMMYRLSGDRQYVERVWQELEAAANFPDWNPSHFLDTAEMTRAFAIGYDWLYDAWTQEQRDFLRRAIVEKGLEPALAGYEGRAPWSGQWRHRTNNWNFVVNSGIAMGALAIAEDEPELAETILRYGLYSVRFAIDRFAPDGAWDEGVGYWQYSIRYLVAYLAALESALGTDFGLGETPGISETGYFPIYLTGPAGSFNFADSGSGIARAPELFWLARRYDKPAYAWWQGRYEMGGGVAPRALLWYVPGQGLDFDAAALPLDRHFREVEVVTLRSDWEAPDATFLALKAGINANHHNHLDVGTFVFDALGVRWAENLGADDYNLPGYFDYSRGRWNYYRNRAEGRNTLVINPGDGPDQNLLGSSPARILFTRSTPELALAVADLTPAYAAWASQVRRGIALFDERRQALIQDEIQTKEPSEVWWFMHTRADVELGPDGATAVLKQGNKRVIARILSPEDASFRFMRAEPLPSSPNPPGQAVNTGVGKLAIHLRDVTDVRLVVQLTPVEEGEYAPAAVQVLPFDRWQEEGDVERAWARLPRVRVAFPTAQGGAVWGQAPVVFTVDEGEAAAIAGFEVRLDERVLYAGAEPPGQIVVDTRQVEDGRHRLDVTMRFSDGSASRVEVPLQVANEWRMRDDQLPPLDLGAWFGTLDRAKTSEASGGWEYATDLADEFFGDADRRVRKEQTEEYLVWEAPQLKGYSVSVYALQEDVARVVSLAVSEDGLRWLEAPYRVEVKAASEGGRYWLELVGEVSAATRVNYFKLTLLASDGPAGDVQIGRVELTGWKE